MKVAFNKLFSFNLSASSEKKITTLFLIYNTWKFPSCTAESICYISVKPQQIMSMGLNVFIVHCSPVTVNLVEILFCTCKKLNFTMLTFLNNAIKLSWRRVHNDAFIL